MFLSVSSSTLERRNSEKSFRAEFIQRVAKGLAVRWLLMTLMMK